MLPQQRPPTGAGARPGRALPALVLVAAVIAALSVPLLPTGPDIYAHLIWTQQVMTDVAAGSPPVWLPDLNAGCGSPGIRLYSPAGPLASGLFGLLAGDAGTGIRLAMVLAFAALVVLMTRRGVERPLMGLALAVTAAPVLADLGTRAAVSELLAVPVAWWLLDRAAVDRPDPRAWRRTGLGLALLWLLHAPTTIMVALLLVAARLVRRRGSRSGLAAGGALAALLTAWHWLPMAAEAGLNGGRAALTTGIFAARRNLLGAAFPHAPGLNVALSAAAVALLAVVLIEGWHRTDRLRAGLVLLAVTLASPLAAPLYGAHSPLAWLQFPWRWLLPACLLVLRPLAERTPLGNPRSWALGAVWLAPLLLLPLPPAAAFPRLAPAEPWWTVGSGLSRVIGSNPLLVDVPEHRPPWFGPMLAELPALGRSRARCDPPARVLRVRAWRPLERRIEVVAVAPSVLTVRLLDYPWWEATTDGGPADAERNRGLLRIRLAPGRHTVTVRWAGNPWSRVGAAASVVTLLGLALAGLRRRRTRR